MDELDHEAGERLNRLIHSNNTIFFNENGNFLHHHFAEYLVKYEHIIRLDGRLFIYEGGQYIADNNLIKRKIIDYIPSLRNNNIREIMERLVLIAKNEEHASPRYISVKNGIYDLEENTLLEHGPGMIITNVYDSNELKELYHLLNKEQNEQMVLIIKMALLTGMRKGEILALQWNDVNFSTNTIHVHHSLSYTKENGYHLKEPKTKGSIRKVAPPQKFMTELKKHIYMKKTDRMAANELWEGGNYAFVFSTDMGKPLHLDSPNRWWTRFLKRTGFKRIRFHDLRHTAATNLINKNANIHSISRRLGHSNIKTTMNIYGHYLEEADQKIADMLDEDYI